MRDRYDLLETWIAVCGCKRGSVQQLVGQAALDLVLLNRVVYPETTKNLAGFRALSIQGSLKFMLT